MKKISLMLLGLVLVSAGMASAMDKTKVIVAKYEADWCQGCKIMKPAVSKLEETFADKGVEFVTFDLTDEKTKAASAEMASEKGLEDVFSKYDSTGMVVLVNPETKMEISQFNYKNTYDQMAAMVSDALADGAKDMANKAFEGVSSMMNKGSGSMPKGSESKGSGY